MTTPVRAAVLTEFASPSSNEDIARAVALLSEGLLTATEFQALTAMDAQDAPHYLGEPAHLAAVQRMSMQLRNSNAIAKLEAVRHARAAVEVAAEVMRNNDMHPSTRLNAANFIAKVSGAERAAAPEDSREGFTITINLGEKEPMFLEYKPPAPGEVFDRERNR